MYFDDTIYPHLSQPLLDRVLRIRALANHATDDLAAALGGACRHEQPRAKAKAFCQLCLIHRTTLPQARHKQNLFILIPPTPHCLLTTTPTTSPSPPLLNKPSNALPPRLRQYMHAANSCTSPPRPINLYPSPPTHPTPHNCDPTQVYSVHIPPRGHATLTPAEPITALHTAHSTPTQPATHPLTIQPSHPEAALGPEGPWWDATGLFRDSLSQFVLFLDSL